MRLWLLPSRVIEIVIMARLVQVNVNIVIVGLEVIRRTIEGSTVCTVGSLRYSVNELNLSSKRQILTASSD